MSNPVLSLSAVENLLRLYDGQLRGLIRSGIIKKTGRGIALSDLKKILK